MNFDGICFIQNFSLPKPIMSHVIMKPISTKAYQKLVQTCKYFYYKNPAILVYQNYLTDEINNSIRNGCCLNSFQAYKKWREMSPAENCIKFLQNIYYCNLSSLCIIEQIITYEEYKLLTKSKTILDIYLRNIIIQDKNGDIVPLDKIMEELPNIASFKFDENFDDPESIFTPQTFQNLTNLPTFQNLQEFIIHGSLGEQNMNYYANFVHKNSTNIGCLFALFFPVTGTDWLLNLRKNLYAMNPEVRYGTVITIDGICYFTNFLIQRITKVDA